MPFTPAAPLASPLASLRKPTMRNSPRRQGRRVRGLRHGFTLKESIAVVVIIIVVMAIAFPVILGWRERARRMDCEANLRKIGQAISRFSTTDSAGSLPIGARYDVPNRGGSTSWWLDILPLLDGDHQKYRWVNHVNSGDFNYGVAVNANIEFADGFRVPIFYCASSPLPKFNDPESHISEVNRRELKGRQPTGIAVPMYTAIAGSAPDFAAYDPKSGLDKPAGRNTLDGPWGILSGSGLFPPNRRIRGGVVYDQKDKTIMIAEQSDYARDDSLDPPARFDVRSAWPRGAFMGTTGNYTELSTTATSVDGDGGERCWNISSVRYPLNMRDIKNKRGIYTDPEPPRAGPDGVVPATPPYPADGYGPGHNNPLISAHADGVNVLMFDGSVKFLNDKMSLEILLMMSTRDDKQHVPEVE
jgi:prepilin-type processing-associated H-X9-DG protein